MWGQEGQRKEAKEVKQMNFDTGKLAAFIEAHKHCQGTFKIMKKGNYVKVRCMDCGEVENITGACGDE